VNRREFLYLTGTTLLTARTNSAWAAAPTHVVIVGAGIMGVSLAYHMARRGTRVTILEKQQPAAGATRNSFAWLNAAGKTPRPYYELNMLGMEGWRRLSLEIGPELLIQLGGSVHWIPQPTPADKLAKI
jgi:glycine/D-amino acid oxidase-like deaminating enzyme